MDNLFRNKYRTDSIRLKNWDYGSNGLHFITICTHEMICFFGDIKNGEMILNDAGKIAQDFFLQIPKQFYFIELDEFVIMPNHVHGILNINKPETKSQTTTSNTTIETPVETRFIACPPEPKHKGGITGNHNPMLNETIGKVIRWYKGRCAFGIRKSISRDFSWQTRFHDHLIRDDKEYQKIANYIVENPSNWQKDKFYKA